MSESEAHAPRSDGEAEVRVLVNEALQTLREPCPEAEGLAVYVERPDALGESKLLLEKHLAGCPACRDHVAGLRVWLAAPLPPPPRGMTLLPRPAEARAARPWWTLPRFQVPAGAAVLACLALFVLSRGILEMQRRQVASGTVIVREAPSAVREAPPVAPEAKPQQGPPEVKPAAKSPVFSTPSRAVPQERPAPVSRSLSSTRGLGMIDLRVATASGVRDIGMPEANGYQLASGSKFGLRVSLPEGAHWVYVFMEDSSGGVVALFPAGPYRTGANPATGPGALELPGPNHAWFELDDKVGEEVLLVVQHDTRIDVLEHMARAGTASTGALSSALAGLAGSPPKVTQLRIRHVAPAQ